MPERMVIAIDGPAGAGKSTAAKALARALGGIYIDTGAMYRAVTLLAIRRGVNADDAAAVTALAHAAAINFAYSPDAGPESSNRVCLDGEDVTLQIRTREVDRLVSQVSAIAGVRAEMVRQQRALAQAGRVVMDGRDIGTTVLPDANCKIFLTASLAERTRRRFDELIQKGYRPDFAALQNEIRRRDELDSQRECSPLVQAADAVVIDTTGKTIEAVLEEMLALCRGR